jgi:hypothetical protein
MDREQIVETGADPCGMLAALSGSFGAGGSRCVGRAWHDLPMAASAIIIGKRAGV